MYLRVVVPSVVIAVGLVGCSGSPNRSQRAKLSAAKEMTEVVVRLRPETARVFHGKAPDAPGARQLKATLSQLGAELQPQHPGTSDSELQSYFTISGVSTTQADSVTAQLARLEGVQSAYVQPSPAPP